MSIKILQEKTFRSTDDVSKTDDMVRVQIEISLNDWKRIKREYNEKKKSNKKDFHESTRGYMQDDPYGGKGTFCICDGTVDSNNKSTCESFESFEIGKILSSENIIYKNKELPDIICSYNVYGYCVLSRIPFRGPPNIQ